MALPQTPRISIKYSITVKGERDREVGRQMEEGKKIKSMYSCHSIKAATSQFPIDNRVTESSAYTPDSKVQNISCACRGKIMHTGLTQRNRDQNCLN